MEPVCCFSDKTGRPALTPVDRLMSASSLYLSSRPTSRPTELTELSVCSGSTGQSTGHREHARICFIFRFFLSLSSLAGDEPSLFSTPKFLQLPNLLSDLKSLTNPLHNPPLDCGSSVSRLFNRWIWSISGFGVLGFQFSSPR